MLYNNAARLRRTFNVVREEAKPLKPERYEPQEIERVYSFVCLFYWTASAL